MLQQSLRRRALLRLEPQAATRGHALRRRRVIVHLPRGTRQAVQRLSGADIQQAQAQQQCTAPFGVEGRTGRLRFFSGARDRSR